MRLARMKALAGIRRVFRGGAVLLCWLAFAAGAFGNEAEPAPLWLAHGRLTAEAQQALDILAAAADDGLDPRDYDVDGLRRIAASPDAGFDAALTAAMERYLADLHGGRVDPRSMQQNFVAADAFDAAAYLRSALAGHRLKAAVQAAAPALPLYPRLRAALGRYRQIAADPALAAAWQAPLPPAATRKLEPGQAYAGLGMLAQRLAVLGDLAAGAPLPTRYEGALVDAVRRFQRRHGLDEDGVIGKATREQLEVKPAARQRQIELAMERLRWTPLQQGPRMIVVNVPEFVLRAYEVRDGAIEVKAQMRVIVGKALDTRTPLFAEDMRFIEFSPYWNVPPSIARAETVPRLRRDPAYFDRQGFEFVAADGRVLSTLSEDNLEAVLRGELRIRQRPGPQNALGDIKFVFPNNDNIYLHHTPSPQLFARQRRDFSHGCIRVEDPVALAKFVLAEDPAWDEARIRAAMEAGTSKTLRLDQPVPVLLAYGTALVKSDGLLYFFPDIYGQDKLLDDALRRRTRSSPAVAGR